MPTAQPSVLRGRLQFLLLATLFGAPLLAAFVLYFYFPDARPEGATNYGQLIDPARPLPALHLIEADGQPADGAALQRKWTLLTRAAGDCDESCAAKLVMTRQTRLALNEKRERVQRVLLLQDPARLAELKVRLGAEHPDLRILADRDGAAARFFDDGESVAELIDPLGNWLMTYPVGRPDQDDFKGLQKDIKRLLRLSHIG
jgi:hypothetical protein